ncbi:MAG TPA: ABC transporter permease [Sedimentisphaerales bacterium]|nr:ABC transporter permease [Sedimentisphaerales bacterium]
MSFSAVDYLSFPPPALSLRWYTEFFQSAKWLAAAWNSVRIAVGTTLLAVALGLLAALGLARSARKGRKVLQVILLIPMMVPPIIAAVAMYLGYARWGLLGTYMGVVLGHVCMALPFVIILISSALADLERNYYDAALTLGADPVRATWFVVLPLIRPSILSGILFAFIISFDEVIVSIFLVKTETATVPKLMFDSLKFEINPIISSISTLLVAITASVLLLVVLNNARARRLKSDRRTVSST